MPIIDEQIFSVLKKFDRPGPRYTSYPTAPLFSSAYTEKNFEEDLKENNLKNSAPISLYLHIPFCDTLCYFCGCNSFVTGNRQKISQYIEALKNEIGHISAVVTKNRKVVQLAWGGGTPSYLTPEEICDLTDYIQQKFSFASDAEISVEIDPRELTKDHLKAFIDGGANRFSLGVQDFNEDVQKAVNRLQPEQLVHRAVQWSRELGIKSINFDLIYGLPLQTADSFKNTLEKVIELSPERIAVFNFAYVPWMKPHQKLIKEEQLPPPEIKLRLLQMTVNLLIKAGYEYIGMDHFAKPFDELAIEQKNKNLHRNFQGYSVKAGADLFGLGVSAISHFGKTYAQNSKDFSDYCNSTDKDRFPTAVGYRMTRDDEIHKYAIMRLMCDLEIDKNNVERKFGITFDEYFADAILKLQEFIPMGLISLEQNKIIVLDAGRFVLRNIAMCFDAYLPKMTGKNPIFSRTV